jgi:prolyl-tRNA synthetase
MNYCGAIKRKLEKKSEFPGKVEIFSDTEKSFGWRVNEAEIKGIPIRITIGSKELRNKTATLNFRPTGFKEKVVKEGNLVSSIENGLKEIQNKMYEDANKLLLENITEVKTYSEFKDIMKKERGFIRAYWCEDEDCEKNIKKETRATTRLRTLDSKEKKGKCIYCKKTAKYIWHFGQAY